MEYKDPGRYIPIIYLLYSWGSQFGVPSRVALVVGLPTPATTQAVLAGYLPDFPLMKTKCVCTNSWMLCIDRRLQKGLQCMCILYVTRICRTAQQNLKAEAEQTGQRKLA